MTSDHLGDVMRLFSVFIRNADHLIVSPISNKDIIISTLKIFKLHVNKNSKKIVC